MSQGKQVDGIPEDVHDQVETKPPKQDTVSLPAAILCLQSIKTRHDSKGGNVSVEVTGRTYSSTKVSIDLFVRPQSSGNAEVRANAVRCPACGEPLEIDVDSGALSSWLMTLRDQADPGLSLKHILDKWPAAADGLGPEEGVGVKFHLARCGGCNRFAVGYVKTKRHAACEKCGHEGLTRIKGAGATRRQRAVASRAKALAAKGVTRCDWCMGDISGLPSSATVCPECGKPLKMAAIKTPEQRDHFAFMRCVLIVLVVGFLALLVTSFLT
jgi:predicted RNA-binding Zn-ribbon protein involved in translation (DUF1610 family)